MPEEGEAPQDTPLYIFIGKEAEEEEEEEGE